MYIVKNVPSFICTQYKKERIAMHLSDSPGHRWLILSAAGFTSSTNFIDNNIQDN